MSSYDWCRQRCVEGLVRGHDFSGNCETDPYGESSPQNVLEQITEEVFGEKVEAA